MRRSLIALILAVTVCTTCGLARAAESPAALNITAPLRAGNKVWQAQPAAAGAPVETVQRRIVTHGADFLRGGDGQPRHHFHCHRYVLEKDKETGLWSPNAKPVSLDNTVDVDGDGKLDDVVAYHEFSLTRPFNPTTPWYDTLAGNPRWYGGSAIYQANTTTSGFTEDGVNQDHDGPFAWPRENWAVFHEGYEPYCPYRVAANWFWQKHDFLNGGDKGRVTFDEHSRLALLLKRYFMGVDTVRFLVRDGEQTYLSETIFRYAGVHTLNPLKTKWAKYDPKPPHDIYFEIAKATFAPHEFKDVTAVGVYCSKDRSIPAYFGYKWYAFECDALVQQPKRPSESLAMVAVKEGEQGPAFYISKTEVPYELWKTVLRQARSNNFVPPSQGFGFERSGDMGSMSFGGMTHSVDEPVTNITLHDTAAWCNALSEQESRTPVYYEDAEFKRPFHEVRRSPAFLKPHELPKLYVKWSADGYRLPTMTEWLAALGDPKITPANAVTADNSKGQTQPVGSKAATANGLYDMLGNVWEYVWTFGDCYDPKQSPAIAVIGSDFLSPADPGKRSASPYGDRPYNGSYNIGLRVVRREAGGRAPAETRVQAGVPAWKIHPDLVAKADKSQAPSAPKIDLVPIPGTNVEMAKHETTFALWKQVRDWAVAHDYETDYSGDMGTMAYWGFDPVTGWAPPPSTHRADEPVTNITSYDMAVWCNALSEWQGRKPVYFADKERTKVYKRAIKYRPIQFHYEADYLDKYGKPEGETKRLPPLGPDTTAPLGAFAEDGLERVLPTLYLDPAADGFRLPTQDEFLAAALPDKKKYPWGNDPAGVFDNAWMFDNAGGTTHPVGQKKPSTLGLYDLFGNAVELSAPAATADKRPARLGGSVLDLTLGEAGGKRNSDQQPATWPYCDTGFRVVRQVSTDSLPSPARGRGAGGEVMKTGTGSAIPRSVADSKPPRIAVSVPVFIPAVTQGGQSHFRATLRVADTKLGTVPGQGTTMFVAETAGKRRGGAVAEGLNIDTAKFDPLEGRVHRGNLGRSGEFKAAGVPKQAKVKWEFATDGPVRSSPVVVDGIAYFGSYDGHVYAVKAADGQLVWKHKTDDLVSGSAAVVDGVVFICGEDGHVYALDARNGALRWKTKCGARMAGSPAVAYGMVFVFAGNKSGSERASMTAGPMVVLDAKDGKPVWQSPVSGCEYLAAVCLDATHAYFGSPEGGYNALDLAGGTATKVSAGWSHQIRPLSSLVRSDGLLIIPGSMRGALCMREARSPWKEVWKVALNGDKLEVKDGSRYGFEIAGSPAVSQGRVLTGCNDGKVYAFDVKTGKPLWNFATHGPVHSSPAVAGETAYFGSWDGHLYAVALADGQLRWKLKLGDMPQSAEEQYKFGSREGGRIISSPWPGDGVIYVGCDNGKLYAVE